MAKKEVEGLVAVIYARYSSDNQREESISKLQYQIGHF